MKSQLEPSHFHSVPRSVTQELLRRDQRINDANLGPGNKGSAFRRKEDKNKTRRVARSGDAQNGAGLTQTKRKNSRRKENPKQKTRREFMSRSDGLIWFWTGRRHMSQRLTVNWFPLAFWFSKASTLYFLSYLQWCDFSLFLHAGERATSLQTLLFVSASFKYDAAARLLEHEVTSIIIRTFVKKR